MAARVRDAGAAGWGLATRDGAWAALGLFALFSLNFGSYKVFGDGELYYSFDQRLFGDISGGTAYNFGTGLLNAPFYGVGKLAEALGVSGPDGASATAAAITIAAIAYVLLALLACLWLLQELGLTNRALALGLAVFGSPLWYYASFSASYSHGADAVVVAAAFCALLLVWRASSAQRVATLGALLGLAVTVRPANAALVGGCLLGLFAFRNRGDAVRAGAVSVATFGLLLLIPLTFDLPLNARADGTIIGSAEDSFRGSYTGDIFGFAPLTPLKMLFSEHRGLFVWTPLTLLALVGYVRLMRRSPRDEARYLLALGLGGLALLLAHVTLVFWDGGWSFSMRYLAALLPIYAIGVAALLQETLRRGRVPVRVALAVATGWAVFVGMNHAFGAMSQPDGALRAASAYVEGDRSAGDFFDDLWSYSRVRHAVE